MLQVLAEQAKKDVLLLTLPVSPCFHVFHFGDPWISLTSAWRTVADIKIDLRIT